MSKETGIKVGPTKWQNKKVKADFKKIITALAKGTVMFFAGSPEGTIKESISIAETMSPDITMTDTYRW